MGWEGTVSFTLSGDPRDALQETGLSQRLSKPLKDREEVVEVVVL